jgi:hypothetical protein
MADSFKFYRSIMEYADNLPTARKAKWYEAIVKYALDGTEPVLCALDMGAFAIIRHSLDKSAKIADRNRANGMTGGAPQGNSNASKNNPKSTQNNPAVENGLNDKQPKNKPTKSIVVSLPHTQIDSDVGRCKPTYLHPQVDTPPIPETLPVENSQNRGEPPPCDADIAISI